jgi:hypothetical protein
MILKILSNYLYKELPLTGAVLLFTVRQVISFGTSYSRDLRSSGILRSVERYSRTNISGPPIDPIFKGQDFFLTPEDGTNRLSGKFDIDADRIYIEAQA